MTPMVYIIIGILIVIAIIALLIRSLKSSQAQAAAQRQFEMDAVEDNHPPLVARPVVSREEYSLNAQEHIDGQRYDEALEGLSKGLNRYPNDSDMMLKQLDIYALTDRRSDFDALHQQIKNLDDPEASEHAENLRKLLDGENTDNTVVADQTTDTVSEAPVVDKPETSVDEEVADKTTSVPESATESKVTTPANMGDNTDLNQPKTSLANNGYRVKVGVANLDGVTSSSNNAATVSPPVEVASSSNVLEEPTASAPVVNATEAKTDDTPILELSEAFEDDSLTASDSDGNILSLEDIPENSDADEIKVGWDEPLVESSTVIQPNQDAVAAQPVVSETVVIKSTVDEKNATDAEDDGKSLADTDIQDIDNPTVEAAADLVASVDETEAAPVAADSSFADDFDFVSDLDNAQINLDLAEQYIMLGEFDSAKRLIDEVLDGNSTSAQKQVASKVLERIS